MKRRITFAVVLLASGVLTLSSCIKKKTFPPEPIIEFKSFEIVGDSAYCTISFTDGDGDFGKDVYDTLAPYTDRYRKNIWMDYYENQGGTWVLIPGLNIAPSYVLDYHTPPELYEEYKDSDDPMQGDILFVMTDYYDFTNTDQFKYEIRVFDRALNESNIVDTGPIDKPL